MSMKKKYNKNVLFTQKKVYSKYAMKIQLIPHALSILTYNIVRTHVYVC